MSRIKGDPYSNRPDEGRSAQINIKEPKDLERNSP
jgi:hypothetical protein